MKSWKYTALTASILAAYAVPASAWDFDAGDGIKGKLNGLITVGTQIRANDPDPNAYAFRPSTAVPGAAPGLLSGQTGGADLNYTKGSQISTVVKGVFDLDLSKNDTGVFARATTWHDFRQGHASVPYGNYPNGFTPGMPLSDNGYATSGKFNGTELRDYYLYTKQSLAGGNVLSARVGRQVLNWGGSQMIAGGINSGINPLDYGSSLRPGAQPFENKLPLGMISAKLNTNGPWDVEGFMPYEFRAAVLPGCGTYFDVAPYAPQGCNFAALAVGPTTEQGFLQNGAYLHKNPDVLPKSRGQFGISLGYKSDALNTQFRGYAMNTHSSMPTLQMAARGTTPFPPGPYASSINNANYADLYAPNIRLFGVSFNTKLGQTSNIYGEYAVRPNQPLTYNAADIVQAFVQRIGVLAARTNPIPVGGTFDAYDRFRVSTLTLGGNKVFPKAMGADRVVLVGEIGMSNVNGLPDTSELRYGRPLPYGVAGSTVIPACAGNPTTVTAKQCTSDGFITKNASGVRMLASALYPNALAGASLTPSLLVAKDLSGYSYDGTFSKGRTTVRPAVRADWNQKYYAEFQWTKFSGGNYNLLMDRSYYSLVAGLKF